MKPQNSDLILSFTFNIINHPLLFNIRLVFRIFTIKSYLTEVLEQPRGGTPELNIMAMRDQYQ